MALVIGAPATLVVRAAKHVNPKATKHHTKTRPKKLRPSDRNRKQVEYPEIKAEEIPPAMTIVSPK